MGGGIGSSCFFKLARIGEIVVREVGHVLAEHEGETAPTTIVFAEEGDELVFGLHGLESLGLEVDPTTMHVRKSEALLAL